MLALGVDQGKAAAVAAARPLISAAAAGALAPQSASSALFTRDDYCRWSKAWPAVHELLISLLRGVGGEITLPQTNVREERQRQRGAAPSSAPDPARGDTAKTGPRRGGTAAEGATMPSSRGSEQQQQPSASSSVSPSSSSGWAVTPALLGLGRAQPQDLLLQPFWAWMLSACLPPGTGDGLRVSATECSSSSYCPSQCPPYLSTDDVNNVCLMQTCGRSGGASSARSAMASRSTP